MSVLLYSDFKNDDKEAWNLFLFQNQQEHRAMSLAIQQKLFLTPSAYPITDLGNVTDWLLNHNDMHQSLAQLLDLGIIPDLSSVDFTDVSQFETWMQNHAAIHDQINILLGL